MPYLSVVVPTFSREEKIKKCLDFISRQQLPSSSFEVIVVDDGSLDDTSNLLDLLSSEYSWLRVEKKENGGASSARNRGISLALGEIVLFIDDDIYVKDPHFFEKHVRFHQTHPEPYFAALGKVIWDRDLKITPFMHWLDHGGPQFAYHKLNKYQECDHRFFYTANVSLKKVLLNEESFDLNFKGWGFEDTELAYRLMRKGMKLIYLPEACAEHDNEMIFSDLSARLASMHLNASYFEEKHEEVFILPRDFKKFLYFLYANSISVSLFKVLSLLFPKVFLRHYWNARVKQGFLFG